MINEELKSKEAIKKWRELVKKYHSDVNQKNEINIKVINNAKDEGDKALLKPYKELMGKNKEILNNKKFDFSKREDKYSSTLSGSGVRNYRVRNKNRRI
jgi:DnaJ-class molecular chaperone